MDGWPESKHRRVREWAESLVTQPGAEGQLAQTLLEALTVIDRAFQRIDTLEGAVQQEYRRQSQCC